jgi:nucleotide-binding universal stress UspA family protein
MAKKILVPLDGSRTAEKIIPQVVKFTSSSPAELHLLQVISPPTFSMGGMRDRPQEPVTYGARKYVDKMVREEKEQEEQLTAESRRYLEKIVTRLGKKGIQAHFLIAFGKDAVQICDIAGRKKFDLIAMATHGRSGLSRWALGSVTDKVLQCSHVPVLVFRVS